VNASHTAYDVAVIGLGAMGSAVTYHLARAGARVVGIDAFHPPHAAGSTHGRSRIIREAYFEDPAYVPLVRRAYENWAALEGASRRTLFRQTGGLMIGAPDSGLIMGTRASADEYDIAVTQLDAREIMARFPVLRPERHMIGLLEHRAGVLDPELCVQVSLALARELGAELRTGCRVQSIGAGTTGVELRTTDGVLSSRQLVVAAGAWAAPLLRGAGVELPLVVERQTMHWFTPRETPALFAADRLPIALIEHDAGRYVYMIPDLGDGVKAAIHYEGAFVDADTDDRGVTRDDVAAVQPLLARFAPGIAGEPTTSAVCLYTNTPDKHFIIDRVPGLPAAQIISACSGHGFKFASAIGELVASCALGESPRLDVTAFRATRWS
jgi:sarcosine oxidase